MNKNSIYEFENHLKDGRMVEMPSKRQMYDIRQLAEKVQTLERPLTIDEAQSHLISR